MSTRPAQPATGMTPDGIAWQLGVDLATARAMHAAPDMLAALRDIVALLTDHYPGAAASVPVTAARAILAQVDGKE